MPRTRFHFSLQFLLDHRLRLEEDAKQQWVQAQQKVRQCELEHKEIGAELLEARELMSNFAVADAQILQLRLNQREILTRQLEEKRLELKDLRAEESKKQQALVQAATDRKAMEILKEQKLLEFRKEQNIKEQKFMDELGQRSHKK
jgi:flagellar FliJ protein